MECWPAAEEDRAAGLTEELARAVFLAGTSRPMQWLQKICDGSGTIVSYLIKCCRY